LIFFLSRVHTTLSLLRCRSTSITSS